MAPRKRAAIAKKEEEVAPGESAAVSTEPKGEDASATAPKSEDGDAAAAKAERKPPGGRGAKRGRAVSPGPEASGEGDGAAPKAQKARRPRAPRDGGGPVKVSGGWTLEPPGLVYKEDERAQGGSKVAGFDLDGTLVVVKSRARFPKDADDWKWYNKEAPGKVVEKLREGYQLAIFSNQGGIKSALDGKQSQKTRERVDSVLRALSEEWWKAEHAEAARELARRQRQAKRAGSAHGGDGAASLEEAVAADGIDPSMPVSRQPGFESIPAQVFLATLDDANRKPAAGMWETFEARFNGGVAADRALSFYVGDMGGRPNDPQALGAAGPSDTDKGFAEAVGVPFRHAQDFFGDPDSKHEVSTAQGSLGLNDELADAFARLAELNRDVHFKAIALRKVSSIIASRPFKITSSKELKGVAGVGKGSLDKIEEFLKTGTIAALEEDDGRTDQVANARADEASAFL